MKSITKYIFLILLAGLVSSCFNDPGNEIVFSGPSQLEWDESDAGSFGTYVREDDGESITDQLVVNLVGPQSNSPVNFSVSVDDLTTAIEGVHYNLPQGTSYTIQPGESSVSIPIEIFDDNIEPDEKIQLVLNISNASIKISANYSQVIHIFEIVCPSDLVGIYSSVAEGSTPDGPYSGLEVAIQLTRVGPNSYRVDDMSFGLYPEGYGIAKPVGVIQDRCGTIIGSPANQDQYGDPFTINGAVDENGIITLTWSNTYGDNGTVTLTKL